MFCTVIIPVHKYNDDVKKLLTRAVNSVKAFKDKEIALMIVSPEDIDVNNFSWIKYNNLTFVKSRNSDYQVQINDAVDHCETDYFSILEFDDEFTPKWFNNVRKEIELGEQASLYLPLTELVDYKESDKGSIGYINEAALATSFSDEIGYLDVEALLAYMNFSVAGGVFTKKDFIKAGKLKESMQFSFWYEYLLRSVNAGYKAYVIPKVGYKHYINRDDSLTEFYANNMKEDEVDFWVDTAKKEYLFLRDRNKTYEE